MGTPAYDPRPDDPIRRAEYERRNPVSRRTGELTKRKAAEANATQERAREKLKHQARLDRSCDRT